jgi:hypothetical protein
MVKVQQRVDRDLLVSGFVGGGQFISTTVKLHGDIPKDMFNKSQKEFHCYQLDNAHPAVTAAQAFLQPYVDKYCRDEADKAAVKRELKEAEKPLVKAWKSVHKPTAVKEELENDDDDEEGDQGPEAPGLKTEKNVKNGAR